jgi:hypothetical protein
LLAAHACDKPPAANRSLCLQPAIDAQQRVPRRQPLGLALENASEHDAVPAQQDDGDLLDRLGRRGRQATAHQAPATGVLESEQRDPSPPRSQTPSAFRRDQQRAQPAVAIGIGEPGGDDLGQRGLGLSAQQSCARHDVVEERGAMRAQVRDQRLRRMRELHVVARRLGVRLPEDPVLPREQGDRRRAHRGGGHSLRRRKPCP